MFEDTLLIIKSDYLHKRKPVLLKLLSQGFQIQGSRKLLFSPEQAAEFYQEQTDDKNFMLQVILLSKGTCEAFILTKTNAVMELMNTMICYFGSSMEMGLNVHVTSCPADVKHEITFIFPNYIHEPIDCFEPHKFTRSPLMKQLVDELYNITCDRNTSTQPSSWRKKLAEWVARSNKSVPVISNQCSRMPNLNLEEKAQQTNVVAVKTDLDAGAFGVAGHPMVAYEPSHSSAFSSDFMSSSTCITCGSFEAQHVCPNICPPKKKDSCAEFFKKKTMEPPKSASSKQELAMGLSKSTSSEQEHGAGIEWHLVSESSTECDEEAVHFEQGLAVPFEEGEKRSYGSEGKEEHRESDEEVIMMHGSEHNDDEPIPMTEPLSAADVHMDEQPAVDSSAAELVHAKHSVEEMVEAPHVENDTVEITGTEEAAQIAEAVPETQVEAQTEPVAEVVDAQAPEAAIALDEPAPAAEQPAAEEAAPQEQVVEDQVAE